MKKRIKHKKRGDILATEFQISLAAARINAGLTQANVAHIMNVSNKTVVAWEKTGKITFAQAKKLSDLYKIPIDYFYLPA